MFPLLAKHSLKSDRLMAYKMQSCSAAERKVAKCRVLHSREICGFDRPAELRRRVACAQQRARVHAYVCVCVSAGLAHKRNPSCMELSFATSRT